MSPDHSSMSSPGSSTANRVAPDVLTYSYASRMVYVVPGRTYDEAIDIAQESFPELRDIERDRICLEVRVVIKNQHERKTAGISRSAWTVVVSTLARFEIVEIRVAPSAKAAAASSSSTSAVVEPPPYPSESIWQLDMKEPQMSGVQNSPRISHSSLSRPRSLANRLSGLFISKSS